MNSYELGKEFEKEAYKFLKTEFDKVVWTSKKNWLSPFDFECYKNDKKYLIDAKRSHGLCVQTKVDVDLFVTKINNKIILIPPKLVKLKLNKLTIQIDLPDELSKKLKIYRIENDFKNMGEALIEIVTKFFKGKDNEKK